MNEVQEQLIAAQEQTITELTNKLNLAMETKAYGLTRFLNLSSCSVTDLARSLLDKILTEDPSMTKSTVKLKGYEIEVRKIECE